MTSAIEVCDLRKSYGAVRAVDGVSFRVAAGEVFALLGPNGAGKTTIIEILEGYRSREAGDVRVLGFDPQSGARAMRERVGIMLQEGSHDRQLSVFELLSLYQSFYPHPRAPAELIDVLGLADKRDARIGTLSGGQKRRVDLALALIGNPDLLFLDEPTAGFDPQVRQRAWELVRHCKAVGGSIVLTSHNLDEVEQIADRVAILVAGRIKQQGTLVEMQSNASAETVISFRLPTAVSLPDLPECGPRPSCNEHGQCEIHTTTPTAVLARLTGWAAGLGTELAELRVRRPSLSDVYLQLVRQGGGDVARDPP